MKKKPLRLIVCGALGRMGSRVADLARNDARFSLAACVIKGPPAGVSEPAVILPDDFPAALKGADAVIDFSAPEASVGFAQAAAAARKPIVIATTGFTKAQYRKILSLERRTPIFLSPNLSLGVNLLFHLSQVAARVLKRYEARVSETHHRLKKDSPSGTALRIAEAVMEGRGRRDEVPIASQRLGDVVGDHTLALSGPGESIELVHRAHTRDVFARGALEAALWVSRKKPGIYDMLDMMGIR